MSIAPTVALKPGHSSELSEKWFKVQIIQPCLTALEFMLLPVGLGIYILINFYRGIWCSQSHDWYLGTTILYCMGFPGSSVVKYLPANAGNTTLIPGLESYPRVGNGNPLQCSCLEHSMDRGAWWAAVHGVTKSCTWLSTYTYNVLFCKQAFSSYLAFNTWSLMFLMHEIQKITQKANCIKLSKLKVISSPSTTYYTILQTQTHENNQAVENVQQLWCYI